MQSQDSAMIFLLWKLHNATCQNVGLFANREQGKTDTSTALMEVSPGSFN